MDWDAPDGLPVHLVFLLLTPTQDEGAQLQILATLARTMGKEAVRSTLVQAPNEQELWRLLQETLRSQDHVLNEQARGRE